MRQSIAINVAYAVRWQAGCRISPLRAHFRDAGVRFLPTAWDVATAFARFYGKTTARAAASALFIHSGLIPAGCLGPKNATFSGDLQNPLNSRAAGKSSGLGFG